ncbi:hypothetical protein [Halobellus limi]|uniref:DUF8053 domain-containing protein n=1 Tax=Halobellus limi TaxID=699433 RepID=A0A1H5VWD6_9EURY|nr:hypothetical protein [Halobellus limi]QCC46597.1 hypothetical protein DV707_02310 [Halobellus limi]SEF91619.1 hypothetical protein SAMN04488133_1094 [Halobellus limi]
MQKLRKDSGSGVVTIPKQYLSLDDVIEDGEFGEEVAVSVERLDRRCYVVRIPDDGGLPDLTETEFVERLVGQRLLNSDLSRSSLAD